MKIWAKTKEWADGKFLVVRRDGTVPHWPHFVLGARDEYAPAALRAYAQAVENDPDGDRDYAASIRELAGDFDTYRIREGDGDPFSPPHRKDDPQVIAAMRGETSMFWARPDGRNVPKRRADSRGSIKGEKKPVSTKYRNFSEMPDNVLRAFADDMANPTAAMKRLRDSRKRDNDTILARRNGLPAHSSGGADPGNPLDPKSSND
jgi:hypothetical protein